MPTIRRSNQSRLEFGSPPAEASSAQSHLPPADGADITSCTASRRPTGSALCDAHKPTGVFGLQDSLNSSESGINVMRCLQHLPPSWRLVFPPVTWTPISFAQKRLHTESVQPSPGCKLIFSNSDNSHNARAILIMLGQFLGPHSVYLGLFLFGVPAVLARPIIDLSEAPRAPVVPSQDLHQRDDGGAVIGGGIHHWFPFILYSSEENGNTGNIGTPAVPDAPQASKLPRGLSPQTTNGPRVENLVAIKHWFPFRNYLSEGNDQEDDTPHAPENILPRQTNNGPRVERATIKHWFPFRHYLSEENHDEDNTGTSAGDAPDAPLVDSRDPSKHTNRKSHIETAIIHWLPFVHYPSAGNNAENQESETPGSSSAARL